MSRKALVLYCALVLGLSWAIQLVGMSVQGDLSKPPAAPYLAATMWTPTLVALGFLVRHRPSRQGVPWRPGNPMPLLPAVLVPTLIAFACVALVMALGWGTPGWFTFSARGVNISGGPWTLGTGSQSWPYFVANVAVTGAVFSLFNGVVTLGEEFGWRAFLQPKLIEQLGITRAVVVLGLVWSFFHLPSLLAGYNFPDHPVLGALVLFPVELVASSFFIAWLTIRARSFWPAVLTHGAANSIEIGVLDNLRLSVPRLSLDLLHIGITVAVGLACWALLARSRGNAANEPPSGSTVPVLGPLTVPPRGSGELI